MKIGDGGLGKILGVYKKQRTQPLGTDRASAASRTSGVDKIELSPEAKEFQVAIKALGKTTYVRKDKVEQLKAKVASGEYNVKAEQVAGKMIDSLFLDEKA